MSDTNTVQAAVVFERTYRASVDELWALWTSKDGFESWWGPKGFRVEVHELEPREGGTLVYLIGRQLYARQRDALFAALVLSVSGYAILLGRLALLDATACFFITASIPCGP